MAHTQTAQTIEFAKWKCMEHQILKHLGTLGTLGHYGIRSADVGRRLPALEQSLPRSHSKARRVASPRHPATPWNIPGISGMYLASIQNFCPQFLASGLFSNVFTPRSGSVWGYLDSGYLRVKHFVKARARHCDARSVPAPFQRQRAHLFLQSFSDSGL